MRNLGGFEYFQPASLREALDVLHHYEERAAILAGGTDLLVDMKRRRKSPVCLVDIKRVAALADIDWNRPTGLSIGALVTVQSIAASAPIALRAPMLKSAALAFGHRQVRNRATVVGNLCNGSPSADMAPPLLALGARLTVASRRGQRVLPLDAFFKGPFRTRLDPDEIVTAVNAPLPPEVAVGHYTWLPKITAVDETLVGVAAVLQQEDGVIRNVRLALGSVAPTPIRAWMAEEFLRDERVDDRLLDEAARIAAGETNPRSRADYRREMSRLLVGRALRSALGRGHRLEALQ